MLEWMAPEIARGIQKSLRDEEKKKKAHIANVVVILVGLLPLFAAVVFLAEDMYWAALLCGSTVLVLVVVSAVIEQRARLCGRVLSFGPIISTAVFVAFMLLLAMSGGCSAAPSPVVVIRPPTTDAQTDATPRAQIFKPIYKERETVGVIYQLTNNIAENRAGEKNAIKLAEEHCGPFRIPVLFYNDHILRPIHWMAKSGKVFVDLPDEIYVLLVFSCGNPDAKPTAKPKPKLKKNAIPL
jgi:hypothetical protein